MKFQFPTAQSSALQRIPLARHLEREPHIDVVCCPFDRRWNYEQVIDLGPGWNPFGGSLYVSQASAIGSWLDDPERNDRKANGGDFLVEESLGILHDYLHIWAVRRIAELAPTVGHGSALLTADTFENQVYCMIVAEAVATVGLDYWYLAQVDLPDVLDIGTKKRNFAVNYHHRNAAEIRRFMPSWDTERPEFLADVVAMYCDGTAPGMRSDAMTHSAVVFDWLRHELSYGRRQREYSRAWLAHLGGLDSNSWALSERVGRNSPWQREIVSVLCDELWSKVRDDHFEPLPRNSSEPWKAPTEGPIDFRFTSLHSFDSPSEASDAVSRRGIVSASEPAYYDQMLASRTFPLTDKELVRAVALARASASRGHLLPVLIRCLPTVGNWGRVESDVFFLG